MADLTIKYNYNGGSGSISDQYWSYGQTIYLSDGAGFTKPYYHLDGWATSESGAKVYNLGAPYPPSGQSGATGTMYLYAHWVIDTPNPPNMADCGRVNDNKVTVSWTTGTGSYTTWQRIYVYRQTDGGSWEQLGYVVGTSFSYTDTTTSANHYYNYRVRAWNTSGYSQYATAVTTIYMTPAAPASVTGEQTGSNDAVKLTVANSNTRNATGFEVQYRLSDSSTWTTVTPTSSTGTPVTSITINNMGGYRYYRVRNTRSTLVSAWTESALVSVITPPNAPTLISPASGAIINGASSSVPVTLKWQHNPKDGTAQTEATIMVQAQGSPPSYSSVTTAQEAIFPLPRNQSYAWSVRTKGVSADWSDWSSTQIFAIYQPPTLSITQPSSTIVEMPIAYSVSYTDNYGVFVSGTISIKLNGNTVYSENLPSTATTIGTASPISGEITTNEFLPSSGNTYTFEVTAVSSNTLSSTTSVSRAVNMGEPNHGTLSIVNDPDTGYAHMVVGWDVSTGAVSAVAASIYRVSDGQRVLIGENLPDGTGITDKYAPLNTPYKYEVVTIAASNEVASVEFDNTIETLRWFAYWGDKLAWAKWNPAGDYKIERPQKRRVHYAGRTYPVSYDGTAVDEEYTMNFTVVDYEEWTNGFNDLLRDGGRGVYKSCDGKVFHADFELTNTPKYTSLVKIGEISLKIVRIEGDVL